MPEVVIRNNNVTVYVTQPSVTETVYVLQGPQGAPGADGTPGADGLGVPAGGAAGTILTKVSAADNDTTWAEAPPSAPSGPAGGDLAGTYPNPTLRAGMLAPVAYSGSATDITTGTLSNSVLPPLAISETFQVASEAAMLALTAQQGDVAVRSDLSKCFILNSNSPGTLADWVELLTPADSVTSVAGKVGVVSLVKGDVGLGNVDNTADTAKPVSTAQQTALDAKATKALGGSEYVAAGSATTGTVTLNCANASIFTISPTGTITLAPSNVPASGTGCTITIIISQGATPQTVNLMTGGVWLGSAPTQAANKACVITALTTDGGTTWYCSGVVQA